MIQFFRGWRRKAGCVLLLMAAVFVGLWIRGRVITDDICFRPTIATGESHWLSSNSEGIAWSWQDNCPDTFGWYTNPAKVGSVDEFDEWDVEWRRNVFGVDFLVLNSRVLFAGYMSRWTISHLSLVIPLTLLSAVLILFPNHKPTVPPKDLTAPVSNSSP